MGVYVDIRNKHTGYKLVEGKYGVGYPILMFSRCNSNGNNVVFEATGKEALNNLDKVLNYLKANVTVNNADTLAIVHGVLMDIRSKIHPEATYISDYSECMYGIDNPNFNPMAFVLEYQNKLEDDINGYGKVFKRDDADMIQMLEHFVVHLSSDIRAWCKCSDKFIVLETSVSLNKDDMDYLNTYMQGNPNDDKYGFYDRYAERKLFYILKKSGFNFEICSIGNQKYHVILDIQDVKNWWATRPYVMCSYRLPSTYDIHYFVKNIPEELEKFYVFAKQQNNVVSVVINCMELMHATDEEIASRIGKNVTLSSCEYNDIDMRYR